ncbi:hypothetical protein BGX23_008824 [Mortierella sp. AD031]|nr:hypothetical protein BGX23_008824 [Mortierella sp. AD031]
MATRTADKGTNEKHTRILKALLLKPGNKFCVDCRKKDPRWASFNLGCFMCIRCSGVHRSMGTHISKVKSIDLDNWTAEQVENMIKWGNEKVNKYWEARLPQSSIPNENTSGIDPWIRSKYEWKQFANKGPVPDPSELGPIDEAMLADLMDRSSEFPGSFGIIAPPPSTPTRPVAANRSSITSPTRSSSTAGVAQGGDLFSIGQGQQQRPKPTPPQEDFFGLNEPAAPTTPTAFSAQNQTQANKRTSAAAAQDMFFVATPAQGVQANHTAPSGGATSPVEAKPGNADWKNSIMSLYGNNQSSAGSRMSSGFSMGQQQQQHHQQQQHQQQQQQRPQSGQFNQLQGMNSFGYGQQPQQQQYQQQYQLQQQQQHQQYQWGSNSGGLGTIQQTTAPSFGGGYNNGFGGQAQHAGTANRPMSGGFGYNSNNTNQGASHSQGGDFFNMIASATKSSAANPPVQNKNSSGGSFGDLSWN